MDFSNTIQLLQYAQDNALLQRLHQQLRKDFTLANIAFDIKSDISIDGLKDLLQEKIYLLVMEHFDRYLNLLYVIDISEKAFKEIRVTDAVEVSQQVSFIILKRELEKILTRDSYSS
ncbi:hypothetical protein [Maribacter aestuarii]|uniref:hypothetical protein n=1 Tax=Maribacter aestuarii TaxID=1130723 RepID=UPI00248B572F|nr:hypothetical protein [Maribacter aestuarii]